MLLVGLISAFLLTRIIDAGVRGSVLTFVSRCFSSVRTSQYLIPGGRPSIDFGNKRVANLLLDTNAPTHSLYFRSVYRYVSAH